MFVFAVDFHSRPLAVCRQMGFKCIHLEFLDISLDWTYPLTAICLRTRHGFGGIPGYRYSSSYGLLVEFDH
jgi:hypothetical protein